MLRVAFITHEFGTHLDGGAGVYATRLATALGERGHAVDVFTSTQERSDAPGVRVLPVGGTGRALPFWQQLPTVFRRAMRRSAAYDVVHGNGIADLPLVRMACSGPRVVTVHHLSPDTLHRGPQGFVDRLRDIGGETGVAALVERQVVRRADRVIAVSRATRDDLVNRLGVPPDQIQVISNGTDVPVIPNGQDEIASWAGHSLPHPLVLTVGRLEHRKGTDLLLRAVALLRRRGVRVHLVLAGAGPTDGYRTLARELGVEADVTFLGPVSEEMKRQLYSACDLFVLASRSEGFGMVLFEAMAFGKAVVATRTGVARDGAVTEAHGSVVEVGDAEALANAIVTLLSNPARRALIGLNNRAWVESRPTWADAAEATEAAYQSAMASAAGRWSTCYGRRTSMAADGVPIRLERGRR